MNIKISRFSLSSTYNDKHVKHGDFVCPANGATSVGRIVEIQPPNIDEDEWEGKNYVVVWSTGKKKGKKSTHRGHTLVLLKLYLDAVHHDLGHINGLIEEAQAYGM